MIASMERSGWVTRTADPSDARRMVVELTADGRALHARIAGAVPRERRRAFAGVSASDVAALDRVLSQLEANLREPS